jgi:uncharacterized membrane-anchored protein
MMRNLILLLTAAVVLVLVNYSIWQRESLISGGRTVLLELAPVDPRSLMQGDYMALRFRLANEAFPQARIRGMRDGRIVLAVDSRNVATFRRFADSVPPLADEALLRYRIRNGQPRFASNAFFFQEKQGNYYREARYGDFRVSSDGEAILVALRGADLQVLGPKKTSGAH